MPLTPRHPVPVALAVVALLASQAAAAADGEYSDQGDEQPPRPKLRTRTGPYIRAQGGYALRTLYGVPVDSGAMNLALGAYTSIFSYYFEGNFLFGSTREGLVVRGYELGPSVELAIWRFRVGGGLNLGEVVVERATKNGSLSSVDWGGHVHLTFDVVRWGHEQLAWTRTGGIFVGIEATGRFDDPAYAGGQFYAGVRVF
jgi:hypothetical protein